MPRIGYHAPHERFAPSHLLSCVKQAAAAGFQAAMCSDHFHPWSETQGQSGYTWSWLGAALESTDLSFGTVSAPGQRYHPAILAQAAATLAEMYPDRLWFAAATGQLLNEGITAERWPAKDQRRARLRECVDVMRALWRGETVTHFGLVRVEEATLFTRPARPPAVFGAALTADTARWAGGWADGMITVHAAPDELRKLMSAFYEGGGAGKPVYVQASHLLCQNEAHGCQEALRNWRTNVFGESLQADLRLPRQYDAAAKFVRPEDMSQSVRISAEAEQHVEWLAQDFASGVDTVMVHLMASDQSEAIAAFADRVLASFRRATG